jgi:hypothetical protein
VYNSKNPCTWDESLPYVQQSYNRDIHSSTNHNPFQVGMIFQPLGPMNVALPLAATQEDSSHAQIEADKATQFIERIQHIHQQVHDILQKSNAKYKQCHDQHQGATQVSGGRESLVALAERTPYKAPSKYFSTPLLTLHHHQVCGRQ